jgi:hypothetical protein
MHFFYTLCTISINTALEESGDTHFVRSVTTVAYDRYDFSANFKFQGRGGFTSTCIFISYKEFPDFGFCYIIFLSILIVSNINNNDDESNVSITLRHFVQLYYTPVR